MPLPSPSPSLTVSSSSPEWRFLALLCLGLAFLLVPRAPFDFRDPAVTDVEYVLHPGRTTLTTPTLTLQGDWEPGAGGGLVAKTERASLSFETDPGPWTGARIKLGGTSEQVWGLTVSRDHQRQTVLNIVPGEEYLLEGERFPGEAFLQEPLKVEIFYRGKSSEPPLLNRVAVRVTAWPGGEAQLGFPGALYASLMPLGLACFLFFAGRRTLRQAAIMAGVVAGVALVGLATHIEYLRYVYIGGMSFFLGAASGAFYKSCAEATAEETRQTLRRAAEWCALSAVIGMALWTRLDALSSEWSAPLLPDARGYLEIAREGSLYVTSQSHAPYIREPFFPALLRLVFLVLPDTAMAARLFTVCTGTVAAFMVWVVGRKVFNPLAGLVAAGVYAINPWLALQSTELLRDDTVVVLFLAMLSVPLYLGGRIWVRAVAFGLAAALLALTRLNGLTILVPLLALEAWRSRWRWQEIVLTLALAILPTIPHLVYNAQVSGGDPLYSANVHNRFYMNWDMMGQPGFPADADEWMADPYAGDVASLGEYAGELGAVETMRRFAVGYVRILVYPFAHEYLFFGREWLMLFGVAGLWVVYTRRRETWWVWVWFGLFLLPLAFISNSRFDPRLALPAVPLVLLVWGAGVAWVGEFAVNRVARRGSG